MSCVLVVCFFIAVMYRLLGLDTISFVIGWMDGMHGFWGIFFFFFFFFFFSDSIDWDYYVCFHLMSVAGHCHTVVGMNEVLKTWSSQCQL